MRRVVCVHGVGQQHKGENAILAEWAPGLRDGIRRAGFGDLAAALTDDEIGVAFYGDLFRPPGRVLGVGDPWLQSEDIVEFERDLLMAWWQGAAATDPSVINPDARTLVRVPVSAQAGLRALSGSRYFAAVAERALLHDLQQVRLYLTDEEVRRNAQKRVAAAVGDDEVQAVVGHSLGAVVAYEALCAHPEWPVRALVTLGAPLGIRNLIFDRLPPPAGRWPGAVTAWTNVADTADVVALVKDLRPQFGPRVECFLVDNGASAHAVSPYLTARETGAAIAAGLVEAG